VGVPALIQIARNNKDREVRRKALFWLGQTNDPRALALFEEINEDLKCLLAQVALFTVTLQAESRRINFNAVESIKPLALPVHTPLD